MIIPADHWVKLKIAKRGINTNTLQENWKNYLTWKWRWNQLRGAFNRFPDFFRKAFKIVVDSWKFSILLLYILWDNWPIFMISGSNQQLQQQLEYTLLKPDCHSWWISKMQSDTLERYAIKFCFKLEKSATETNASNCFWSILHESSISFWVA